MSPRRSDRRMLARPQWRRRTDFEGGRRLARARPSSLLFFGVARGVTVPTPRAGKSPEAFRSHSLRLSGGRPRFDRAASRVFDVYARMLRPAS